MLDDTKNVSGAAANGKVICDGENKDFGVEMYLPYRDIDLKVCGYLRFDFLSKKFFLVNLN